MTSTSRSTPSSHACVDVSPIHCSRVASAASRSAPVSNSGTTSRASGRDPTASRARARTATRSPADWLNDTM